MGNLEAVSGVDSYVLIGEQTAFGTEQTTVATHLGLIRSFKPKTTNTNSYARGFKGTTTGGRNVAKIIPGVVDHTVDIDMDVIDWTFMKYVVGYPSSYGEADQPKYFTLHHCIVNPGSSSTSRDEIWQDCVIDSCSLRCSTNGAVTASLSIRASQRKYDSTVLSTVALPSVEVFNFVNSSLSVAGAAVVNVIDSMEITFSNNYKLAPGIGSRFYKAMRAGERDYKIKFTVKYLDDTFIVKMLGSATPTGTTMPTDAMALVAVFGNNAAATGTFTFAGVTLDDLAEGADINQLITEDMAATAKSLTSFVVA
jgi:hypothetical protein